MKNKHPILARCAFVLSLAITSALAGWISFPGVSRAQDNAGEAFLPHRAVYALQMRADRADGIFSGARGAFEYTWARACDGWDVTHEAEILFNMAEDADVQTGWRVSTWEAYEGDSFRYEIQGTADGRVTESVRGAARLRGGGGGGGSADFAEPNKTRLRLPEGTYFPTDHSLEMMKRLEAPGDSFFAILFDGSSVEEGLTDISAIAQREVSDPPENLPMPELFEGKTGLSVAIAYYLSGGSGAEPLSEQQVVFYDNGIVTELVFDFGEVALEGVLVDLELLDDPDC